MSEIDLDELRSELSSYAKPAKGGNSSAKEQRIIAGFEEIERFVAEHDRLPEHGEDRDIFERIYAVRLDCLRASAECRTILKDRDSRGLLSIAPLGREGGGISEAPADDPAGAGVAELPSDDELLSALRGDEGDERDIAELRHVRSREEIRAAEEVAKRNPCEDFDAFRPVFEEVQQELAKGRRQSFKYKDYANVRKGDLFILDGQKVIVAEMGDEFVSEYGRNDRRLRVVYDNGTESDLLLRSLQRALNKDKVSRRISEPSFGPLFSSDAASDDSPSGQIYVLRSCSEHSFIAANRHVIHKIGVTGGEVKRRIANARLDPTFLLAEVEIVAVYKLANVDRVRLERLLHRFFAPVRLDLELTDRFGSGVQPQEWFLAPLPIIEEAIGKLIDGTIENFRYDPAGARIVEQ